MRKNIAAIFCLVLLFVIALPVNACGGFVAIKGEKIVHSVYCTELQECNFDKFRWFSSIEKAKNNGLSICDECSEYCTSDWDYDSDCGFKPFTSENQMIQALLEATLEYGMELGNENGYEVGWGDAMCAMEYGNYEYDSNNSYSWNDLDEEYDNGYESGYDEGFKDGLLEADRKHEAKQEEIKENRKGVFFTIIIVVAITAVLSKIDKKKYRRN